MNLREDILLEHLVTACKCGDEKACNTLYKRYYAPMLRICRHYVHDDCIARDLLHDSFIVIFTSIDQLKEPAKLDSWVKRIVNNMALQYLRKKERNNFIPIDEIKETGEIDTEMDIIPYPALMHMINSLPTGYSRVFRLSVLEGLSHKEIGEKLGIAPHSASSQLSHAKSLLRKKVNRYMATLMLILAALGGYVIFRNTFRSEEDTAVKRISQSRPAMKHNLQENSRNEEVVTRQPSRKPAVMQRVRELLPTTPGSMAANEKQAISIKPYIDSTTPAISSQCEEVPGIVQEHLETVDSTGSVKPWKPEKNYAQVNTNVIERELVKHFDRGVDSWAIKFAYNGISNVNTHGLYYDNNFNAYPEGESGTGPQNDSLLVPGNLVHHRPIMLSLEVSKRINDRWALGTGITYTMLKSTSSSMIQQQVEGEQNIHYIGIPLKLSYTFWRHKSWHFYVSSGVTMDIPVRKTFTSRFNESNDIIQSNTLHVPIQWSVNGSIGVQYNLTPSWSIFTEPGLYYYFDNGTKTFRSDNPKNFIIPIGFKFSF